LIRDDRLVADGGFTAAIIASGKGGPYPLFSRVDWPLSFGGRPRNPAGPSATLGVTICSV